ncbi:outer membrane protein [Helicobacter cetorum]|uniref:outer membrane protein n=1 Tax=Helicobacter cetorum TaxID=138563 RepID=UPI000CF12BBF|nr:outer membrane beta-barrel protein [Helicobacter cetorum]
MKVQAMIFNKKFLKASLVLSVLLSGEEVLAINTPITPTYSNGTLILNGSTNIAKALKDNHLINVAQNVNILGSSADKNYNPNGTIPSNPKNYTLNDLTMSFPNNVVYDINVGNNNISLSNDSFSSPSKNANYATGITIEANKVILKNSLSLNSTANLSSSVMLFQTTSNSLNIDNANITNNDSIVSLSSQDETTIINSTISIQDYGSMVINAKNMSVNNHVVFNNDGSANTAFLLGQTSVDTTSNFNDTGFNNKSHAFMVFANQDEKTKTTLDFTNATFNNQVLTPTPVQEHNSGNATAGIQFGENKANKNPKTTLNIDFNNTTFKGKGSYDFYNGTITLQGTDNLNSSDSPFSSINDNNANMDNITFNSNSALNLGYSLTQNKVYSVVDTKGIINYNGNTQYDLIKVDSVEASKAKEVASDTNSTQKTYDVTYDNVNGKDITLQETFTNNSISVEEISSISIPTPHNNQSPQPQTTNNNNLLAPQIANSWNTWLKWDSKTLQSDKNGEFTPSQKLQDHIYMQDFLKSVAQYGNTKEQELAKDMLTLIQNNGGQVPSSSSAYNNDTDKLLSLLGLTEGQLIPPSRIEKNNTPTKVMIGSTPFELQPKSQIQNTQVSGTKNLLQNTLNNMDSLNTALSGLSDISKTLTASVGGVVISLNSVVNAMKQSRVNVNSLGADISNILNSLDNLDSILNIDIDNLKKTIASQKAQEITSIALVQETTPTLKQNETKLADLQSAQSVVGNAIMSVRQIQSNVVAVAAQKGILPQVTLPATTTQSVSGSAYGVDVQIGYKYFFGKTKHWGIRGYATYAYMQSNLGHTTNIQGAGLGVGQANNHTYGAGFDFLYNFHESQDGIHTAGILLGTELLGSTWVNQGQSIWHARMEEIKALGGKASMNTSYFQIPLVVGFRSNFSKHSGIELGLKIPLVVNYYFRSNYDGFEQSTFYKNNIKLYFNYVVNF